MASTAHYQSRSPRRATKAAAHGTTQAKYSSTPDQFYGHEDTAKMCARFITHLFSCPDVPPATSSSAVTPSLAHFVAYALHRTRLHSSVTFCALYLLSRLKNRFPAARGSSGHRLYISAFMIASKVICDDTYSNKSWCVVGQGMFTLREINQMEREMCGYLEWVLNVKPEDLRDFEAMVRKEYGSASAAPAPVAVPIPRQPVEPRKQSSADYANGNPYPSPVSTPPSPSHSNSTSPASSTCQTPPSADPVKVPTKDVAPVERSQPFAYAAPSVW
ncbi:Cyclin, N-terminal domain [Ceratobasidium sp. AG-Ba]|nr:Cyclin, N-terminal domain [Ceratobasidium sp. AG-Ba]QRW12740.1 Cyclin, N-terminal domain [Ceratobasidium sp. AG-Ba]